ncbi:hypothetical protein [Mucilaginibacter sp.]
MHASYKSLLILLFLSIVVNAYCQKTADTTSAATILNPAKEKSTIKIGADYMSNNVFMGRTGLITTPIISPTAKYTFGFGLYVSSDADFLPDNKKNKLDGGNLTAGYDFDITDNLSGGISYSKLFYNANSTLIGSSITNTFDANLDYNIANIITPSVTADYNLNSGAAGDFFLNISVSHDFIIERPFASNDAFIISPTIATNVGTQNFYNAYIQKKVFKNKKVSAAVTKFETTLSQFKTLDYEFSAPLEYKIGVLIIQFTPTYAVVQNGFKSAAVAKAVGLSNNNDVVYFDAGLAFKF